MSDIQPLSERFGHFGVDITLTPTPDLPECITEAFRAAMNHLRDVCSLLPDLMAPFIQQPGPPPVAPFYYTNLVIPPNFSPKGTCGTLVVSIGVDVHIVSEGTEALDEFLDHLALLVMEYMHKGMLLDSAERFFGRLCYRDGRDMSREGEILFGDTAKVTLNVNQIHMGDDPPAQP